MLAPALADSPHSAPAPQAGGAGGPAPHPCLGTPRSAPPLLHSGRRPVGAAVPPAVGLGASRQPQGGLQESSVTLPPVSPPAVRAPAGPACRAGPTGRSCSPPVHPCSPTVRSSPGHSLCWVSLCQAGPRRPASATRERVQGSRPHTGPDGTPGSARGQTLGAPSQALGKGAVGVGGGERNPGSLQAGPSSCPRPWCGQAWGTRIHGGLTPSLRLTVLGVHDKLWTRPCQGGAGAGLGSRGPHRGGGACPRRGVQRGLKL